MDSVCRNFSWNKGSAVDFTEMPLAEGKPFLVDACKLQRKPFPPPSRETSEAQRHFVCLKSVRKQKKGPLVIAVVFSQLPVYLLCGPVTGAEFNVKMALLFNYFGKCCILLYSDSLFIRAISKNKE